MDILTFATADYQWLLHPFCALLGKYWPGQHVICFGNENQNLPEGVEFRPFSGDFVENFGAGVSSALKSLDDDIFVVTLADMWLRGPVMPERVEKLVEYMASHIHHIVRVGIGNDTGMGVKGRTVLTLGDFDVCTADTNDPDIGMRAGLLLWSSLWNRELVLGILEDCTLWDFEIRHSPKVSSDSRMAVWTASLVYPYVHVFFRHNQDRVRGMRHFSDEDKSLIRANLPPEIVVEE